MFIATLQNGYNVYWDTLQNGYNVYLDTLQNGYNVYWDTLQNGYNVYWDTLQNRYKLVISLFKELKFGCLVQSELIQWLYCGIFVL